MRTVYTSARPYQVTFANGTFDAIANEWHGRPGNPIDLNQYFGHHLLVQLGRRPDDAVVQINHDTGSKMTALEMRLKSLKIAEQLVHRFSLLPGDAVTLVVDQHDDLAPLVIGLLVAGMVVNPMNPDLTFGWC